MSLPDRIRASLTAAFIGDALSMPVHWYYNTNDIKREFGVVKDMEAPKPSHPSSIMNLASTGGQGRGSQAGSIVGDVILRGRKQYWRKDGHYHATLQRGENTLNLQCTRLLLRMIGEHRQWDSEQFLRDYIAFMTNPHPEYNDCYAESFHREFFKNFTDDKDPKDCAGAEGHDTASMGALPLIIPVVLFYAKDGRETATTKALQQLRLTHRSARLEKYATSYIHLLLDLYEGKDLRASLQTAAASIGVQLAKLVDATKASPVATVVGGNFSIACYIDDSLPSLYYLAYRFSDSLEDALIANTNAGGENCHRGAALGAVLGLALGPAALPDRWVSALKDRDAIAAEIAKFVAVAL